MGTSYLADYEKNAGGTKELSFILPTASLSASAAEKCQGILPLPADSWGDFKNLAPWGSRSSSTEPATQSTSRVIEMGWKRNCT